MIREATATAATVDEAKEKALDMLGDVGLAEIEFDVIDLPTKKTFGLFGGNPAKVRAFFDDGKDEPNPAAPKAERVAKSEPKPAAKAATKPAAPKAEKPAKSDPVQSHSEDKAERPIKAATPAESTGAITPYGKAAESYLKNVLAGMGLTDITMIINETDEGAHISLEGEGLGVVIGRRGETLDALQYLVSLACNNDEGGFYRVVLDTGGYREKRESTLQALAAKMARQALRTHRNQSLEPMNPYERRIIHTAVQDIDGVTSWSVSDGRNRRVIIGTKRGEGDADAPRFDRHSRDSRPPRGDRRPARDIDRKPRQSAPAVTGSVERKASDATAAPLYGRIDK